MAAADAGKMQLQPSRRCFRKDLKVSTSATASCFNPRSRARFARASCFQPIFHLSRPANGSLLGTAPFTVDETASSSRSAAADSASVTQPPCNIFALQQMSLAGRQAFLNAIDVTLEFRHSVLFSICKLARLNSSNLLRTSSAVRIKPTRVCGLLLRTLYALRFDEARPQNENSAKHSRCLSIARRWRACYFKSKLSRRRLFLPQWLSGYAFLFPRRDGLRAREGVARLVAGKRRGGSFRHCIYKQMCQATWRACSRRGRRKCSQTWIFRASAW